MTTEITFTEDVLDSRDIIARFDELETEIDALKEELANNEEAYNEKKEELEDNVSMELEQKLKDELEALKEDVNGSRQNVDDWWESEGEEYRMLEEAIEKFGGYGDWDYGETLIHEDYWVEYVEELCKEVGDVPSDLPWYIADCIDWEAVADNIAVDYMTEEIKGNTYYMRNC